MDMSVMEHKLSCLEDSIVNALVFKLLGDQTYATHLCQLLACTITHGILLGSGCKTPEEYEAFIMSIPEEGLDAATVHEMLSALATTTKEQIGEIFSTIKYDQEVDEDGNLTCRAAVEFSTKNFEEST